VEELADRPEGYKPIGKPGFRRLLPLSEIIAAVLNVDQPATQAVWKVYNALISRFGDEYTVLLDASEQALKETVDQAVASAIVRVRRGAVTVVPGFDGVYGRLVLDEAASTAVSREVKPRGSVQQLNLGDFW
jgi:PHP family Zn ribbon phosphoesterase